MSTFGIDAGSAPPTAQSDLIAGSVQITLLPLDSLATKAVGQVLVYDSSANNWVNYASGVNGDAYAVCFEASDSVADASFLCITKGDVDKSKLDATSKADADIEAALLSSGMRARYVDR